MINYDDTTTQSMVPSSLKWSRIINQLINQSINQLQDAQLSQRDRAAGCIIVFAKSRRLELGDNILRTL